MLVDDLRILDLIRNEPRHNIIIIEDYMESSTQQLNYYQHHQPCFLLEEYQLQANTDTNYTEYT